jgi:hypothetical protein
MVCAWGGSGHYLVKDNITGADVRGSHTIMARVKWTTTTTTESYYPAVLCTSAATSGGFVGRLASDPDGTTYSRGARFSTGGSYNKVSEVGTFGDTTTWRHLCMVYNATTQLVEYYVDGVSQGTISSTTSFVASDTAGAFGILAKGKIADVALYNRALTASEVASMAAYRQPQVTSNLLGFYRMDTNSSGGTAEGNATDTSGNGNTLVATTSAGGTGFTYSTADNPPQPENPPIAVDGDAASSSAFAGQLTNLITGPAASSSALAGKLTSLVSGNAASSSAFAGALRANVAGASASSSALAAYLRPRWSRRYSPPTQGLNSSLTVPGSQPFTVMGWMKIVSWSSGDNAGLFLTDGGSNSVGWGVDSTGDYYINTGSGFVTAADDGAWHHYAIVWDGVSITRYRDGTGTGTSNTAANVNYGTVIIGSLGGTGTNAIEVSQIKLWAGRALNSTEVNSERLLHNPHVAPVSYWWQFTWQNPTWDDGGTFADLDNGGAEAQFEPPGDFTTPVAGASASSSALAGVLRQSQALAAGAASSSSLAAMLSVQKPAAGALASSSAFSASIALSLPLASAAASSSAFAGTLTSLITGPAASSSAFAGNLNTVKPVAGDAASSSGLLGALQALLTSAAASSSAFSGSLNVTRELAGAVATSSAFSGTLGISGQFATNMASSSAFAGALGVTRELAAAAATSSAFSAALGQTFPLAGTLSNGSAFTGTLFIPAPVAGAAASSSALSGVLTLAANVAGASASSSAFQGTITAQIVGGAASSSALSGSLQLINSMTGQASSSSAFTGNLTVNIQNSMLGDAASASAFQASLSVQVTITVGDANVFTGASLEQVTYSTPVAAPPRHRQWPPRPR